jgi:hypothetical protein
MWEGLKKNGAKKTKKSAQSAFIGTRGRGPSPSAGTVTLGEEAPSLSAGAWHSGKRSPSPSARAWHSEKTLFSNFWQTTPSNVAVKCKFPFASAPLPRVLHSGKMTFPECHPSLSAMGFATLGKAPLPREDWLPRVPDFWHSRKSLTLGEFQFSRSEACQ